MCMICITEDNAVVGIEGGSLYIKVGEDKRRIPKAHVEGISLFGNAQVTTQCIKFCMEQGINLSYFSKSGFYSGELIR